jgi:hypothetical protein
MIQPPFAFGARTMTAPLAVSQTMGEPARGQRRVGLPTTLPKGLSLQKTTPLSAESGTLPQSALRKIMHVHVQRIEIDELRVVSILIGYLFLVPNRGADRQNKAVERSGTALFCPSGFALLGIFLRFKPSVDNPSQNSAYDRSYPK